MQKKMQKMLEGVAMLSTMVCGSPKVKKGQAVEVKLRGKKFKIIVVKPNGEGRSMIEGTANGKTFVCSFIGGEWIAQNNRK